MEPVSVFVCEAQPIVIEGLLKVFSDDGGFLLTGSAPSLTEALERVRSLEPTIVLIDQTAGTTPILRFVASLKSLGLGCYPVLWCADLVEADGMRLIHLGIRGVVKKSACPSELVNCLREVAAGRVWMEPLSSTPTAVARRGGSRLTAREKQVVELVCGGLTNRQISLRLGITPGTVKVHLMHIFEKTGLRDRFALALQGSGNASVNRELEQPAEALKPVTSKVDQS